MLYSESLSKKVKREEALQKCEQFNLLKVIHHDWKIIDHQLSRKFIFNNFKNAYSFVQKLANFSENVNHHPEIRLSWGQVEVVIWTHSINGLHRNDFIWAAKVDRL